MDSQHKKQIFAHNLRLLMKEHKITQAKLSNLIDVSPTGISNWLQQITYPRKDKIQKLCDLFDVPQSYLTHKLIEK